MKEIAFDLSVFTDATDLTHEKVALIIIEALKKDYPNCEIVATPIPNIKAEL